MENQIREQSIWLIMVWIVTLAATGPRYLVEQFKYTIIFTNLDPVKP